MIIKKRIWVAIQVKYIAKLKNVLQLFVPWVFILLEDWKCGCLPWQKFGEFAAGRNDDGSLKYLKGCCCGRYGKYLNTTLYQN